MSHRVLLARRLDAPLSRVARIAPTLPADTRLPFADDEGDRITVSTDTEVADACAVAFGTSRPSLKLEVSLATTWTPTTAPSTEPPEVHHGVTCDVSGMSPIVGPRFHMSGSDFDLCEAEYLKLDAAARGAFVRVAPRAWRCTRNNPCAVGGIEGLAAMLLNPPCRSRGGGPCRGRRTTQQPQPSSTAEGPTACTAAPAVHHGVTCDRSGTSPIVGPRFHLPGSNFDLCEAEFLKLDAAARGEFVKIDRPRGGGRRHGGCRRAGGMGGAAGAGVENHPPAPATPQALFDELRAAVGDPNGGGGSAGAHALAESLLSALVPPAPPSASATGDADDDDGSLQAAIEKSLITVSKATAATVLDGADEDDDGARALGGDGLMPTAPPTSAEWVAVAAADPPSPPASPSPTPTTRYDAELAELASLGFGDDAERNVQLLERYQGRVGRVINFLLDLDGN